MKNLTDVIIGVPRPRSRFVQVRNPKTDRYIKIDREKGAIVATKRTAGPYKGVPIIEKPKTEVSHAQQ
jgi:hypothetical protein